MFHQVIKILYRAEQYEQDIAALKKYMHQLLSVYLYYMIFLIRQLDVKNEEILKLNKYCCSHYNRYFPVIYVSH